MASKYHLSNPEGIYFITFATVQWVDVLTRPHYKDIVVESLRYCQEKKGRDLKKYTAKKLIAAIQNPEESRRVWLLWLFRAAGEHNPNNQDYQSGNRITTR